MKKLFMMCSISCVLSLNMINAFAERCPTPAEIKTQGFGAWHLFYDGEQANNHIKEFKSDVKTFAQADYMPDVYDGPAQCFYQGQDNRMMEMYLVRFDLKILENNPAWKKGWASFSCTADINDCQFIA